MKNLPQISEAEFEVMKIVWKYAPINTNEITEKLLQTTNWSPKTIQTLIKRLARWDRLPGLELHADPWCGLPQPAGRRRVAAAIDETAAYGRSFQ